MPLLAKACCSAAGAEVPQLAPLLRIGVKGAASRVNSGTPENPLGAPCGCSPMKAPVITVPSRLAPVSVAPASIAPYMVAGADAVDGDKYGPLRLALNMNAPSSLAPYK